ncbi:neutral cholesterol ester hydrolase 1-like [Actinia tenebrosa]|uniref:Neutral cholesterol ester hydrolase 1-like n=1 Tax=Actinia tenebrosa TaxID=6105 RepID=A0A6P8II85_ACTTE|nr:neutral cholesterol ester hydrolase 1-like [Actinia tenebrosa]
MRGTLVILAILAVFSAIIIHQLHKRLFGIPVPDGLNPNSTFSFQVVGFLFNFAKDLSRLGTRLGIVNNYHISVRNLFEKFSYLVLNNSFADQLEINDTEIFGSKVRIYKPVNKTKDKKKNDERKDENEKLMPALIYYHGGGWTIGSLAAYDAFCRRVAVTAQVIVVSADYKQAPEYLYPTAFNQCYNVAVGLLNTGAQYGVDVKRVMVGGDSAGGNLAAAVTHTVAYVGEKHCRKQYIAGQILIYPSLQMLNFNLPSYIANEDGVILSRHDVAEFVSVYLTGNTDIVDAMLAGNHSKHLENTTYMSYFKSEESDEGPIREEENEAGIDDEDETSIENQNIGKPLIEMTDLVAEALINIKGSPLVARNFRGVPQTLLLSAECDPLRDEAFLYAKRLKKAGIDVVHKHYPSFHGFVTVTSEPWPYGTVEAREAIQEMVRFIDRMKKMKDKEQEEEEQEEEEQESQKQKSDVW